MRETQTVTNERIKEIVLQKASGQHEARLIYRLPEGVTHEHLAGLKRREWMTYCVSVVCSAVWNALPSAGSAAIRQPCVRLYIYRNASD